MLLMEFFPLILFLHFCCSLDKNTSLLVDDHKKIAIHYVTFWLAFDVISIIQSELAMKISLKHLAYSTCFGCGDLEELVRCLQEWRKIEISTMWVGVMLICVTLFAVIGPVAFIIYLQIVTTIHKLHRLVQTIMISIVTAWAFVCHFKESAACTASRPT